MRFFWWALSICLWVMFVKRLEPLVGEQIARAVDSGGTVLLFLVLAILCMPTRDKP